MSNTIIIDGIYGQDASYLAKFLLENGNTDIIGITRRSGSGTNWRHAHLGIEGKIKIEYCDITEPHQITELIKKYQPKEYYHLAAQSFVKSSFDSVYSTINPNIIGTLNILEAIRYYSPKTRLYNASSCLPAGTKILVKRPYERFRYGKKEITESLSMVNIEDLKVGDSVLSMNMETSKKESCIVKATSNRIAYDMYTVYFENGNSLRLSGNHPVYVVDKGWVRTDELRLGYETIHKNCAALVNIKRKGKTNVQLYGEEKACSISLKSSESQKNSGYEHPWKNKKIKDIYNKEDLLRIHNNMSDGQKNNDYPGWNFGLTKETDDRLKKSGEKISKAHKKLWSDPNHASKMITLFKKVFNKQEQKFLSLLNDNIHHDFVYNGDGKFLNIEGKLPDFVDLKRKKIIEFNGDYWHRNDIPGKREEFFKNYGYETLIVWQSEFNKNPQAVLDKVKTFIYNPDVELSKIVKIEVNEPERVYDIEVEKNHNFFANCVLVHNSEMFGRVKETPQDENTSFCPVSPYGVSKLAAHELVRVYRESYGLFACSGILFNHESRLRGIEFVTKKITNGLSNWKRTGKPVVLGNLNAKRDWGHSADFTKAMVMMLSNKEPKDYVVATGKTYSIREFIIKCLKVLDVKYKNINKGTVEEKFVDEYGNIIVECSKEYYRENEVDLLLGKANRIKKDLGWTLTYTIDTLIEDMLDYEWDM